MNKEKKGFKKKRVEALMLGERLIKLREKHGITIKDLSENTKIQEKYLKALENGFYNKLPSPVYIKGYLREYENFFNLREEVLVKAFEKEYKIYININENDELDVEKLSKTKVKSKIILTPKFFIITFIIIIFLGIGGYLYYGVNKFISDPWITIESPKNGLETDKKSIIIKGFTNPDAILEIGGKKIFVDKNGFFSENISLVSGKNLIIIKSKGLTDEIVERTLRVFSTRPSYKDIVNNKEESESLVILKSTRENLWISIRVDESENKKVNFSDNSEYQFRFKDKIEVSAESGNKVTVNINGEDKGVLSEDEGKVEGIIFMHNVINKQNDNEKENSPVS